jgi:hypothetical protein
MAIVIDGTGTISGVTSTGLSSAQTVTSAALPAGSVLQVVNATYATSTSTGSQTYSDLGLTATITPKFSTSKILVLVSVGGQFSNSGGQGQERLVKGSSTVLAVYDSPVQGGAGSSTNYLDSPATTSATSYKVQVANRQGTGTSFYLYDNCVATMTLLEIAA